MKKLTQSQQFDKCLSEVQKAFSDNQPSDELDKIVSKWEKRGLNFYTSHMTRKARRVLDVVTSRRNEEHEQRIKDKQMTVGKLLSVLSELDPNKPVVINGSDYADDNYYGRIKHITSYKIVDECLELEAGEIY